VFVTVFFSLFFEVEPFAAVVVAHGTHGRSQKFVMVESVKFEAEGQEQGRGAWDGAVTLRSGGSAISSQSGVRDRALTTNAFWMH